MTTHEYLPDQKPRKTCSYYDQRGLLHVEQGISFTTQDKVITPLIYYGVNAHGQRVRKIAYLNGAMDSKIDPAVWPKPIDPDPTADAVEIQLTDNRGKIIVQKAINGRLETKTYNETGQLARHYGPLSNYPDKVHLDEKRMIYDAMDRTIIIDLRRDNISQQQTALLINVFGESIAEGPKFYS